MHQTAIMPVVFPLNRTMMITSAVAAAAPRRRPCDTWTRLFALNYAAMCIDYFSWCCWHKVSFVIAFSYIVFLKLILATIARLKMIGLFGVCPCECVYGREHFYIECRLRLAHFVGIFALLLPLLLLMMMVMMDQTAWVCVLVCCACVNAWVFGREPRLKWEPNPRPANTFALCLGLWLCTIFFYCRFAVPVLIVFYYRLLLIFRWACESVKRDDSLRVHTRNAHTLAGFPLSLSHPMAYNKHSLLAPSRSSMRCKCLMNRSFNSITKHRTDSSFLSTYDSGVLVRFIIVFCCRFVHLFCVCAFPSISLTLTLSVPLFCLHLHSLHFIHNRALTWKSCRCCQKQSYTKFVLFHCLH